MFDANAAYIKTGELFFAEVHCTDKQLENAGVKVGDIILCEHVKKGPDSPRENLISKFWVKKGSDPFEWKFEERSDDWSWMVYSGKPDGKGFIDLKWEQKALYFMGGKWE